MFVCYKPIGSPSKAPLRFAFRLLLCYRCPRHWLVVSTSVGDAQLSTSFCGGVVCDDSTPVFSRSLLLNPTTLLRNAHSASDCCLSASVQFCTPLSFLRADLCARVLLSARACATVAFVIANSSSSALVMGCAPHFRAVLLYCLHFVLSELNARFFLFLPLADCFFVLPVAFQSGLC